MKVDIGAVVTIIAGIITWFKSKQKTWDYLVKIVTPLIAEAEKMALDGVIDKKERKALVMMAVAKLEKDKIIKLNFITRWLLGKVIDRVSAKLPDITVSKVAKEIMKK